MRVLVIGGTGLIGSAIVRKLRERDDEVWMLTRGTSHRAARPDVKTIVSDRTTDAFVDAIKDAPTFDCVIDMVCYEPIEAETAVKAFAGRVGQYILTSTVDVYRKPATRYPYREDEPYGGIGDYATKKVRCEEIVREAHDRDGFPMTIIRPAATYGDRHLPVHTLGRSTTYLDRLSRGKPIVVHGDGSSMWSGCHADDVARAFVGAAGNPKAIGRCYHATGEEWLTWNDFHVTVAEAIGAPNPRLVHIPTDALVALACERAALARDNFQFSNIFDNTAAHTDLDFRYTIPLREGLPPWYQSLLDAEMIEDSDTDQFEDQLIRVWHEIVATGAEQLGSQL